MERAEIRELITDVQFVEETVQDKTFTKVKGIAKKANHINLNRRYYTKSALIDAVNKAQDKIKNGGLIGLMDHPSSFEGPKGSSSRTAIKWTDMRMVDDDVVVEGIVVETAAGKDLQALIDAKVKIDLSTNMRGQVRYVRASELDKSFEPQDAFIQVFDKDLTFNTIDVVNGGADQYAGLITDAFKEDVKSMTLDELKKDNPELYEALMAEARGIDKTESKADDKILDEVVKLRQELDAERAKARDIQRRAIVDKALAEAKLPTLGKVGDIDLDARLRTRLDNAAISAEDDAAASAAVADIIAEQKALLGAGGDPKDSSAADNVGVRPGSTASKAVKSASSIVSAARGAFGL